MTGLWLAFLTAGAGLILLLLLVATVPPHVRRFTTAAAALRVGLARSTTTATVARHRARITDRASSLTGRHHRAAGKARPAPRG